MSHALAWQMTSRSRGLTKSDRSQNVCGSGAKPSDVKKRSAVCAMSTAVSLCAVSSPVSE